VAAPPPPAPTAISGAPGDRLTLTFTVNLVEHCVDRLHPFTT